MPETDRFFNVQVLDAWTNTAAVLEAPGAYAIAYSGWEGTLPEGVRRIDVPTRTVWTIARIMLSGPDDLPNVAALQSRMQLMPLSAYPAGPDAAPEGSYSPENDFVPVEKVLAMRGGGHKKVISYFLRNGVASVTPFPVSAVLPRG